MKVLNQMVGILSVMFLALSLAACAGSLETQILDELEQEEASDASNATDAGDPSEASDASDPTNAATEDPCDASDAETQDSKITNYPQDDGVVLTLADATEYEQWVYFDFETQSQVYPANPVDSALWDVAFMRYRVKLNGGYYGTGDVIVSAIEGVTLQEVTEAPEENWLSDQADFDDDDDELPEEALATWYEYDSSTHILTPHERVYAIRSAEGTFFKFEFSGYYNQEGASGNPSIRWATVPAPAAGIVEPEIEEPGDLSQEDTSDPSDDSDPSDLPDPSDPDTNDSQITNYDQGSDVVLTLADAASYDSWVYFDFETQSQVYPENPVDSAEWDLAFKRYQVKLNGGYHGTGQVIVTAIEDAVLADVSEVPLETWITDTADTDEDEDTLPQAALSDWYEYDGTTHVLTPYERVYAIRSVEGAFFKFEFAGYYSQNGSSGHPSIRWSTLPEPSESIVEPEIEPPGDTVAENEG